MIMDALPTLDPFIDPPLTPPPLVTPGEYDSDRVCDVMTRDADFDGILMCFLCFLKFF